MAVQRKKRAHLIGMVALSTLLACGLVVSSGGSPTPSQAVDASLPTWDDVEAAKQNEAAAAKKVKEIEALLVQVKDEVERTRAASAAADAELRTAEQNLFGAQERTEKLTKKAEQSAKEADEAAEQAAALVSQLYRSGGVDRNLELFLESDDSTADQLLERLAQVERATERNTSIADSATQTRNTAQTLGKQAKAAEEERDRLREEADERKREAEALKEAAYAKLVEQEANQVELEAQLEALTDKTVKTTKGYQERLRQEEAERRAAEEAARKAAEEAARRAAEQAAANAGGGGGGGAVGGGGGAVGGGGGGGGGGQISSGWRVPLGSYWVSDWFGVGRWFPGASPNHTGVDLAAPGWTPIHAASSGTVTISGWTEPCYGNMVEINHGGGITTRYGHQARTPVVAPGQWVNAGDIIGYVGTTGCSTGDHLHFEVLSWGSWIDPVPFYAARGLRF